MKNKQERLENIALLNVIAILLVILGHSGCIYAGKWEYNVVYTNSSVIKYITNYIYSFHMPLFVFISGYLYCYGKNTKNKYKSLKELSSKKIRRLIIPYLLIGTFFVLPVQMFFCLDNDRSSYFKRVLNEIILANQPRHLWFILMLFNLFIIFYFVEKYLSRNNFMVNILILFIVSIVSIKFPNIYQISQGLRYLLFFYIGYSFYKYRDVIISIKNKWLLFFIVHSVMFNFRYFIINNLKLSGRKLIVLKLFSLTFDKFVAFFGIVFIFTMIEFLLSKRGNVSYKLVNSKLLDKMSRNNFFIYLVHQPIMLVILKNIRNIQIKPIIVYNILFWFTLVISFSLAENYYFIVHKWRKIRKLKFSTEI